MVSVSAKKYLKKFHACVPLSIDNAEVQKVSDADTHGLLPVLSAKSVILERN
jgi:hypothetical protein